MDGYVPSLEGSSPTQGWSPTNPRMAIPYGPVWPRLTPFGLGCPYLAPFGSVWFHLASFGPIWPHLAPFGPFWPGLAPFGFNVHNQAVAECHPLQVIRRFFKEIGENWSLTLLITSSKDNIHSFTFCSYCPTFSSTAVTTSFLVFCEIFSISLLSISNIALTNLCL